MRFFALAFARGFFGFGVLGYARGEHFASASHGLDVDSDGNGLLEESRLYQLVRQHGAVRERTLEIMFVEAGAEAYVFTFG